MSGPEILVKINKLQNYLNALEFPLYFLDYETYYISGTQRIKGMPPQIPFQYSLHKMETPESDQISQTMYLHDSDSEPTRPLLEQLMTDIGEHGSVLVWNDKFEKGCNDLMSQLNPSYKFPLRALNSRIRDLADPYKYDWVRDPRAPGRWSLKIVMPLLFPSEDYPQLDYQRLNLIREGGTAQKLWMETVMRERATTEFDGETVSTEQILAALREYCTLDTLSMVFIYQKYLNWVQA
jgi:hypothetical protein